MRVGREEVRQVAMLAEKVGPTEGIDGAWAGTQMTKRKAKVGPGLPLAPAGCPPRPLQTLPLTEAGRPAPRWPRHFLPILSCTSVLCLCPWLAAEAHSTPQPQHSVCRGLPARAEETHFLGPRLHLREAATHLETSCPCPRIRPAGHFHCPLDLIHISKEGT